MQRTELIFGLGTAEGGAISDADFQIFLRDVVTPRFPTGLTVLAGSGQWRNDRTGRIAKEPCRMLILIHPIGRSADQAIEQIRSNYKSEFRQESVLRADVTEQVSF